MSGKDFEDRLADSLDELVGDNGVALLRKQSFSFRRGSFQMAQEADILVDSRDDLLYSAFEAKSRNFGKIRPNGVTGLYFSKDYTEEQIEKEAEYARLSGRRFYVGVELIDFRGADSAAFLLPLSLFETDLERELTKVTWEKIAYVGVYIGGDDGVAIDVDTLDTVDAIGAKYEDNPELVEDWVEEEDDGKTLPSDINPVIL
jgi:hypothetical protein